MKKLSTDSKSELVILQEKEHRIQQEIDAIESRLNSLKRVSNLLRLVEKCGAYIQDPNHNSIVGLEYELKTDKAELNRIKDKIKQIKNTPTNVSNVSSNTQSVQNTSSSFTLMEKIIGVAVVVLIIFLVLDNYSPFYEWSYDSATEKYGFINIFNRVKIPYEYEDIAQDNGKIDVFYDKICWMKKDGLWGAINKRNKVIVPFEYESDSSFLETDELSELTKNGKHGLITKDGEILIHFEYDEEFRFDDNNISLAVKSGKVGAINTENEIIIPFEYELLQIDGEDNFHELRHDFNKYGMTLLMKNNKIGVINNQNNILIPFDYDWAYDDYVSFDLDKFFNNGIAVLKKEGKLGAVNMNNEILVPFEYDYVYFELWNNDRFYAEKDNKYYEFDLKGNRYDFYYESVYE